jgi:hypothetical protein
MSVASFKSFCIENYAEHITQPSSSVYQLFKDSELLEMLDSDYGDLHGMSF